MLFQEELDWTDGVSWDELKSHWEAALTEVRRLRRLLQDAWNLYNATDGFFWEGNIKELTAVSDRLWLACLEMGLDELTDHQVECMSKENREPYISAIRIWSERTKKIQHESLNHSET